jgi:hypothetical protein
VATAICEDADRKLGSGSGFGICVFLLVTKYRAIRTSVDGITFASKKEAGRYKTLKLLEKSNKISNLKLQPRFPIKINGALICTYVGDFEYIEGGRLVIEDVKGLKSGSAYSMFRLKAKLMRAILGIEIFVT